MDYISIISMAANKVGISASLLISLCTAESNLRPVNNFHDKIHSSLGICQIQVPTAREIVPHIDMLALQQPSTNAYIAAKILKKKIKKYGFRLGIASYNSGSPRYKNGKLINQYYVDKVLKLYYTKLYEK